MLHIHSKTGRATKRSGLRITSGKSRGKMKPYKQACLLRNTEKCAHFVEVEGTFYKNYYVAPTIVLFNDCSRQHVEENLFAAIITSCFKSEELNSELTSVDRHSTQEHKRSGHRYPSDGYRKVHCDDCCHNSLFFTNRFMCYQL